MDALGKTAEVCKDVRWILERDIFRILIHRNCYRIPFVMRIWIGITSYLGLFNLRSAVKGVCFVVALRRAGFLNLLHHLYL